MKNSTTNINISFYKNFAIGFQTLTTSFKKLIEENLVFSLPKMSLAHYNRCILPIIIILYFGTNVVFSQNEKAMPAPINTAKFTEYAPSVSADGKTLIFESDRQGDWKLFESHMNGKVWSVPTAIPKITTTFFEKAPLGGPCVSYDGNLLFFSANGKDSDGHEDIYYSIREKGGWSAPMNLGSPVNTVDYEGYPSLSADGKYLYFARAKFILGDKKDAQQRCYRIMRAERGNDGKWQTPVELPSPVNVICEKAPRIMPDGKTLMFSSIRKDGQGNFDIYKCELQPNGNWTEAVALDFLNTSGADQFVAVPACGDVMYYVQDGDIFTANIPIDAAATVQGYVTDSSSNVALAAKVMVSELNTPNNIIAEFTSNSLDGRYSAVLKPKGKYLFEISEAGFYRKKVVVDLSENSDCEVFEQDFRLIPLGGQSKSSEMYKLSFLAIDAQTNLTLPANFEAKEVTSGQSIALQYNPQTLQNQGSFRLKEDYSIEASMKGYKNSSLSLRVDDKSELLAVSIIKLDPISSNFVVKAFDGGTNELLKDTKVTITEVATNQVAQVKVNPETGECGTNLLTGNQYKIVISSEFCEDNEQTITKTDNLKELIVKLIPKKVYTANLIAYDLEKDEPIDATFTITSEKTGKVYKGVNIKAKEYFPVSLIQNDNLKVEVTSEGFATARTLLEINNIKLGERDEYRVKLVTDRYPLLIKVLDAETQKPIKEASIKITDLKTAEVKQGTKNKTNDFSANIKRSGFYEIAIKAEDYIEIKEKIDKAPAGDAINFTLLRKKRLPVNFMVMDGNTSKPVKATFSVKLEKEQKTFSFKDESDGNVKVAEREIFTVETSAEGYKPKQSTFNMADFSIDKKYAFEIRLEKALFVVDIKAVNKVTNETVKIEDLSITDLTTKTNKVDIVKLPAGNATVSLLPENKYRVSIEAEGYEKFEQEVSKLAKNELICVLTPKPQASALIFTAVDSTSGKVLDAVFKITPAKTSQMLQGKTSENTPEFKLDLYEEDNFNLETFVKGYYVKNEKVSYKTLGKPQKHTVTMSRNFSVLSLKAYDANTNKPIREVFYSLIDAMNNKPVAAMITLPNGECSADLKPGHEYLIKAKLAGYDDYESRFTASINDVNKDIKMRSLRKYNLFLYAIDARKKNKISANFTVHDASGEVVASGKTDALREQMAVVLTEKTNYLIEIMAAGYKPYEGKLTPDSSMKGEKAMIASWLTKDDSKFTFTIKDSQTRKTVEKCTIKLIDINSNQELVVSKNGEEYSSELSPVASYRLEIDAQGYAKYINRIDPNSDRKRDISLIRTKEPVVAKPTTLTASTANPKEKLPTSKSFEKIEKGKAITLNNVYFEQSSFIMQKESYPELDKVVSMMKANPQTKIEIGGHTDNIGDQRLNLALSENRAKVILNYLVSKGINEDRLFYKGYGGTKPVAPNDTEDNKKKNRRVEIIGIQ
ncbi:MAG: OmpA family protein [Arcicella sp.]|jgi:outer membrane protein OmpA-like peptidoglycan-associated protein/Tol biopolymer transport system component|nr:OmpA family protein [Arcicella sp.]